jgi:hypothetical protein
MFPNEYHSIIVQSVLFMYNIFLFNYHPVLTNTPIHSHFFI